MVGNSVARWARAFSLRDPAVPPRRPGCRDWRCSARSIRPLSCGDWNTPHHWPGMSRPCTMRCASPPGMPAGDEIRSAGRRAGRRSALRRDRAAEVGPERAAGQRRRGSRQSVPTRRTHQCASATAGAAAASPRWRRENRPIAAGSTVRNSSGAISVPPTTTIGQRPLHLAADRRREGGGQQADAGRDAGHQHRPHLQRAGLAQGLLALEARVDQAVVAAQHHDAVHGGDAEQGDEADGGGDAEGHAGQEQRQHAAGQRHRNGAAGQQRVAQRAEADVEQQQDQRRWRSARRSPAAAARS